MIRSPNCPAHSESLHRLSYPGPHRVLYRYIINTVRVIKSRSGNTILETYAQCYFPQVCFFLFTSQPTMWSTFTRFQKQILNAVLCFFIYTCLFSDFQVRCGSGSAVIQLSKCGQYSTEEFCRKCCQKAGQLSAYVIILNNVLITICFTYLLFIR
jgi:hypothetical protein